MISFRDPLNYLFTTTFFLTFQHHVVVRSPTCLVVDWIESFKSHGWFKCGKANLFITGFYRLNPPGGNNDPISLLEQAKCCNSTPEFSGQKGTCTKGEWRSSLDQYVLTHIILFHKCSCSVCGLHACMYRVNRSFGFDSPCI